MKAKDFLYENDVFEFRASPTSLKNLATGIDALAGMEFEMIVPDVDVDDGEMEPDYDMDERVRSFDDIRAFFDDGEYNSRRDVDALMDELMDPWLEYVDEAMYETWHENMHEYVGAWVRNNVSEDEVAEALGLDPEEIDGIGRAEWNEYIEKVIDEQGGVYDDALDDFRSDFDGNLDEQEFLTRKLGIRYASDVSNTYQISWPHWRTSGDGEADLESVAMDFSRSIGRKTNYSSQYHGGQRQPNAYVVEPDGSLDPDEMGEYGLEFVSPPLPVSELLADLKKVKQWADNRGCYTNDSTGLHINVSVPNFSADRLDYVKLALLLGDEYVLEKFGRASNTYAKSAMQIIRQRVAERPEDVQALLAKMKGTLDDMATKIIHSGATHKYTSINTKTGYIEFRSPGGDWLNSNFEQIESTLMRFVVALDAAVSPDKYRNEYLKKLYKLLQPAGNEDPVSIFARYSAGLVTKSELKNFVQSARLSRDMGKGKLPQGQKYWWSVSAPRHSGAEVELVATSAAEALQKAREEYPSWRAIPDSSITAKPLRPYTEQPQQAAPQPTTPGDSTQ